MEPPSAEVAALTMLLTDDVEVHAGDPFPCGWLTPEPTLGTLRRYVTATPEMLDQAHALADAWRENIAA